MKEKGGYESENARTVCTDISIETNALFTDVFDSECEGD